MQCVPVDAMPGVTEVSRSTLVDLAGNAFNGASYMAVLLGLLAALPCDLNVATELPEETGALSPDLMRVMGNMYEVPEFGTPSVSPEFAGDGESPS